MFIILAYIKFLLRSSNQHGVHSPFVYGLVTRCFYNKKKHPAYETLRDYRNALLKEKQIIKVTDFGAGSRVFRADERRVSEIAKNAGISARRARLLNRLVRYLKIETALELGTSVGLGTAALAAGNKVQVTSIEGCYETAGIAAEKFREFGLDKIQLKVGKFEEVLEEIGQRAVKSETNFKSPFSNSSKEQRTTTETQQTPGYDLIFIDGNHKKDATLFYFNKLLPGVHNDTVMIFDDIHWSVEMEQAWEQIKQHAAVKVTIDTFQWGMVFFRREQQKEHFVIRV